MKDSEQKFMWHHFAVKDSSNLQEECDRDGGLGGQPLPLE